MSMRVCSSRWVGRLFHSPGMQRSARISIVSSPGAWCMGGLISISESARPVSTQALCIHSHEDPKRVTSVSSASIEVKVVRSLTSPREASAFLRQRIRDHSVTPSVLATICRSLRFSRDVPDPQEVTALIREVCNQLRVLAQPFTYAELCQCLEAFRGIDPRIYATQRLALELADQVSQAVSKRCQPKGNVQPSVAGHSIARSVKMSGKTAARLMSSLHSLSAALSPVDNTTVGALVNETNGEAPGALTPEEAEAFDRLLASVVSLVAARIGCPSSLRLNDIAKAMTGVDGMSNHYPGVCMCLSLLRKSLALCRVDTRYIGLRCPRGTGPSAMVAACMAPLRHMTYIEEAEGHRVHINPSCSNPHIGPSNSSSVGGSPYAARGLKAMFPSSQAMDSFPSSITEAEAFVLGVMGYLQRSPLSVGGFDPADIEGIMTGLQGMLSNTSLMHVVMDVLTAKLRALDSSACGAVHFPFSSFASALYCMQDMSNEAPVVDAFLSELSRVYLLCNEDAIVLLPDTPLSISESPPSEVLHEACLALFGLGKMRDPSVGLERCLEGVRRHLMLVAKRPRLEASNVGGGEMYGMVVSPEQLAAALWGLRGISSGCDEAMAVIRDLVHLARPHVGACMTGGELALCLGGLANKRHDAACPSATMQEVLRLLQEMVHAALASGAEGVLAMDDDAIAIAASGLAAVYSDDPAVRSLLTIIAESIEMNGQRGVDKTFTSRHLSAMLSCIRCMSSAHPEVLSFVGCVTRRIDRVRPFISLRPDVAASAMILDSIQGVDNAHPEVKALIASLTPCIFNTSEDISCTDIARAVHGFRSMTDGQCTATASLLDKLRHKIISTLDGDSTTPTPGSASTTATAMTSALLLSSAQLAMCVEGLSGLVTRAMPSLDHRPHSDDCPYSGDGGVLRRDTGARDSAEQLLRLITHRLVGLAETRE